MAVVFLRVESNDKREAYVTYTTNKKHESKYSEQVGEVTQQTKYLEIIPIVDKEVYEHGGGRNLGNCILHSFLNWIYVQLNPAFAMSEFDINHVHQGSKRSTNFPGEKQPFFDQFTNSFQKLGVAETWITLWTPY